MLSSSKYSLSFTCSWYWICNHQMILLKSPSQPNAYTRRAICPAGQLTVHFLGLINLMSLLTHEILLTTVIYDFLNLRSYHNVIYIYIYVCVCVCVCVWVYIYIYIYIYILWKGINPIILPPARVNSRVDWLIEPCYGTQSRRRKTLNLNLFNYAFKLTKLRILLLQRGIYIYIYI